MSKAETAEVMYPNVPRMEGENRISGAHDRHKPKQADLLISLATDAEFFHTPEGVPYATVYVGDHRETWPVRSRIFRRWLARLFFAATSGAPNAQAMTDALGVLEARASFDGATYPVFVRLAKYEDTIYLDLADEHWRAVEVTSAGWCVLTDPPVRFRRPAGMLPLPEPQSGGSFEDLRPFINAAGTKEYTLCVAYLLGAFHPHGPYPVLELHGEQGSAKTTVARVLRAIIDPNVTSVRAEPREIRDLMIAAANGWVMAYDNLSRLPPWLSDALCRLSTGGGFSTRELYTDSDEVLFDAMRPVILTGIEELATRGDLLDRSILIHLPVIPEDRRRTEAEFWAAFELVHPQILGALLTAASTALYTLPFVKVAQLPRMADFALWATAAEHAIGWAPGTVLETYGGNRNEAHELALDTSPVAVPIRTLVEEIGAWEGRASDLLHLLDDRVEEMVRRQGGWPQTPQALSGALRRLAANLRAVGIAVEFGRTRAGRWLSLKYVQKSVTVVTTVTEAVTQAFSGDAGVTIPPCGDAGVTLGDGQNARSDARDDGDVPAPPFSAGNGELPPPKITLADVEKVLGPVEVVEEHLLAEEGDKR